MNLNKSPKFFWGFFIGYRHCEERSIAKCVAVTKQASIGLYYFGTEVHPSIKLLLRGTDSTLDSMLNFFILA